MITFCNPPLASATTSCESMGAECSLAQLGSAAMLIGFPFGTVPSSFTTPRTLADADPVLKEAGLTGPAARPPVRANNRIRPGTKILVDRKSTRLNSSHLVISYAVFCLKKKNTIQQF